MSFGFDFNYAAFYMQLTCHGSTFIPMVFFYDFQIGHLNRSGKVYQGCFDHLLRRGSASMLLKGV